MEINKRAYSATGNRKFIVLESKAGVANIVTNPYSKWSVTFKLASGFSASNIDCAVELLIEVKRVLQNPDREWESLKNG